MKHVTFVHYTPKVVELICNPVEPYLSPCNELRLKFIPTIRLQRAADTTITSQHRSEVDATIANSSILPHSDWLASSDRSKPISTPYLRIIATVSFNLTTAKISKYSAMIGLLRLDEASQSE